MVPIISKVLESLSIYTSTYKDFNIYIQLSLSFGLVKVNSIVKSSISTLTQNKNICIKKIIYTLAYKVLNMPIFFNVDLLALEFKPTKIFQLANKILESKVPILSLHKA